MRLPRAKIILFLLLFGGIFALINFVGLDKPAKDFFYSFSRPLQAFFWTTGNNISGFFSGFFNAKNIRKENESLRSVNQELLSEFLFLRETKSENEFLKNSMGLGIDKEFELMLAQIVFKDVLRDSILIDKGLKDGIRKNQPVLTGQRALLGKIGEVYENFAEVILISNSGSSFDAKISGTDTIGVVKGNGRSEIRLEFVPKDKELRSGSFVVSAALGGIFPEGILIGEVREVENLDTNPFQSASISPSFNLKQLDRIFIIKNFDSLQ